MRRVDTPALLVLLCFMSGPLRSAENVITLPTELKISSVAVSIHAPLGWRYRPGESFPLEILINNPGPAMDAELMAVEGGADAGAGGWAERGVPGHAVTLPSGTARFQLPMRAPGVSANIVLIVRGTADGGGKAELFRASLSRILRPLPPGGRIVVVCGGRVAPQGPFDQVARFAARDMPDEGWMWESVDWVVLNDATIKEAQPEARAALRRWLLGGGRMFLGSREALAAALSVGLLPVAARGDVPADLAWWEKNAGVRTEDVLAAKNFRPVYARLRHGFGQIVFLFPGADAADADGAAVFNRADLQRPRVALPDARVQPELFTAFVTAAPSPQRRRTVMLWSAAGALILCAGLFFARTSRTKFEAALLPAGAGALLAVLLAKGFPQHQLTVSRLRFERYSADGAAVVCEELALLEAVHRPLETSALGPKSGTFAPRFDELDDLRAARLDRWAGDGRLALDKIAVAPNQPALLHASFTDLKDAVPRMTNEKVLRVLNSAAHPRIPTDALSGINPSRALWIQKNGETLLLQNSNAGEDYRAEPFSARALAIALTENMDSGLAKARTQALGWAIEDAAKQGGGALIFWNEAPHFSEPLIAIDNAASAEGSDFLIRTVTFSDRGQ